MSMDLDERPDPEDGSMSRGRHRVATTQRRPWAARPRVLGVIAIAVALVAAGLALLIPTADPGRPGNRSAVEQPPTRRPSRPAGPLGTVIPTLAPTVGKRTLAAGPVTVTVPGFFTWALFDEKGKISGSADISATTWIGSVLKVWMVADFLRRSAEQGWKPTATQLAQARRAIRDNDDRAAEELFWRVGGAAQLRRMVSICKLTDTKLDGSRWREVRMSARDTVRLGRCVTDGRAAGRSWTTWVRAEMTKVRGTVAKADQPSGGRWGIVDGLPADLLATGVGVKNDWTVGPGGNWRVNCLAVADHWALAVLLRYPAERGLRYGADTCAKVAAQLVSPPAS